jgi:hypothetical protein
MEKTKEETFEEFTERNKDKIALFQKYCDKPYNRFGQFPSFYLYPLVGAMDERARQMVEKYRDWMTGTAMDSIAGKKKKIITHSQWLTEQGLSPRSEENDLNKER